MAEVIVVAVYGTPAVIVIWLYLYLQGRRSGRALEVYRESMESGLVEPASLHPTIDYSRCLGCATCVDACPEKDVLGVIDNQVRLISPASCIGHGACRTACPTNAIDLVFGTATRGVDIPHVGADFQTNVPGIYIAGELGGMGLIRNAIEQGRQAVAAIRDSGRVNRPGLLDVVIVGAGPAGISAALAAREAGLSYLVLEQDSIGGTISHYPRGKVVMTAPAQLPLLGEFQFRETSKEHLMEFWTGVVAKAELAVRTGTRVSAVDPIDGGFAVEAAERHAASNVLLAIGRRGTPRTLGVPGEALGKVVYRLVDPQQYRGTRVLVVGGGDSALEAAISLAEEPGTEVVLSYRGTAFNRVKSKNRQRLAAAVDAGQLDLRLQSTVREITPDAVYLNQDGAELQLPNDHIIVCAGGILPNAFLESIGVTVETHYGTAV
ncbi:NAD(P)-binding domain-containing protein [Mangrovimicrobium sediminis]|uniref:NAD(P)-binding domain-containing protein n=1 Tax=Mangrovimicrobium sediminis TaxID=2562682 RepID=UPI00197E37D9|nr:NAD(P)-binding domain-containing protein [Haliea sp. SAOS-164]